MICRCLQDSLKLNLCFCSHCPCGLEESPERKSVKNYLYFAILNESQPLFLLKIFSFPCFYGSTVLRFCSHFFLLYQVLEKTHESPLDCKESNQSILKEISPGCSLEGLMLKLKLQYFGHLMWRADSLEKTLMLGKIEGGRRRGRQRMRWLDGITDSVDVGLGEL